MVTRPSLPICNSPGLAVHQWNALREANRANCIALICWVNRGECATIDVDMAIQLSEGRKSVPWGGIDDRYKHPILGEEAHLNLLEPWIARS